MLVDDKLREIMFLRSLSYDMDMDEITLQKRKPNRLKNYEYNRVGAYFITICTHERKRLLWSDVGASIARPQDVVLSEYGVVVDAMIREIAQHYPTVSVDYYVIMPNHVHLLLQIHGENGRPMVAPTISTIVQQMKGAVTKRLGFSIWQKLFHDHVIRNQHDYKKIAKYICENPIKWEEDCFYCGQN